LLLKAEGGVSEAGVSEAGVSEDGERIDGTTEHFSILSLKL
jgi:hypothetical protein